ncbi:hypothetical protein D3C75_1049920 [compost metagenome]
MLIAVQSGDFLDDIDLLGNIPPSLRNGDEIDRILRNLKWKMEIFQNCFNLFSGYFSTEIAIDLFLAHFDGLVFNRCILPM